MAEKQIPVEQIPPGEILTYYGDIASGAIRPEDVCIEALTFRAIIDGAGNIQQETPKVTVIARYNLAIRAVYAAILNPEFAGPAAGLTHFNIREQGRNWSVFREPVTLSPVANGAVPFQWDGVYITIPGTDLQITWSIDTVLWASLIGATKIAEVVITGDYIACGPQGR